MRSAWVVLVFASAAAAQGIVDPGRIPGVVRRLEPQPDDRLVECSARPLKPAFNFSLRLQAGWMVRVPMSQYEGTGHRWFILTRITPEDGTHQPVYMGSRFRLPEVPRTRMEAEVGGVYLVGEGRYSVRWLLYDDSGRVCRHEWRIDARLGRRERDVSPGMSPGTVAAFSIRPPAGSRALDDAAPIRLTVLLDAAPLSPGHAVFRASDMLLMLGTLSSLLEHVPVLTLRLVVFNLDQQRELLREDAISAGVLDDVAQSVANLQFGAVDYHILQNPGGPAGLLARLINQEIRAQPPSDVVLFLGPRIGYADKLPPDALAAAQGEKPRFFNFQYFPFRGANAMLPDIVMQAVAKARGRTIVIHTPADFARAIEEIERAR